MRPVLDQMSHLDFERGLSVPAEQVFETEAVQLRQGQVVEAAEPLEQRHFAQPVALVEDQQTYCAISCLKIGALRTKNGHKSVDDEAIQLAITETGANGLESGIVAYLCLSASHFDVTIRQLQ